MKPRKSCNQLHNLLFSSNVCVLSHVWLCDPMGCSLPGFSVHGDSPDKNTGVGCHFLFHSIFLTQGLKLYLLKLLHWQVDSLPLEHLEKPLFYQERKLLDGSLLCSQPEDLGYVLALPFIICVWLCVIHLQWVQFPCHCLETKRIELPVT